MERFVVVHGQIILNQFKYFPKKSVANSAFATGLKQRMEQRRHCKLYMGARDKARVRGLRANPMRDRASVRMKPMTATATTMVKAIWKAYFVRTGQQQAPGSDRPGGQDTGAYGCVGGLLPSLVNEEVPFSDTLARHTLLQSREPGRIMRRCSQ